MQPYRKTQDLLQTYVSQLFNASHQRVRTSLEFGNDDFLHVTTFNLVEGLAEVTGLSKTQIYTLVGTSQPTSSRDKKTGTPATVEVADRVLQTAELFARAAAMIGPDNARRWLVKQNRHLDGKAPVDLMRTATGRERLSRHLDSLEDVTYG